MEPERPHAVENIDTILYHALRVEWRTVSPWPFNVHPPKQLVSHDRAEQSPTELDVLISGGSMGGLATGIVLADSGHTPTIYERSTGELKSRGGGIVAQQNIRQFLTEMQGGSPRR